MARKAPPAAFVKGDPRASAAGKKSSRALPPELKDARLENANKVESILYKYMGANVESLQLAMKDPATPSIELIVIKIITEAIRTGDNQRLEFLLQRTIGKITDKLDIRAAVATTSLHQQIIDEIENGNK